MKLSEAIRLGAMLKPQAFGELWRDGGQSSCALGAAYNALGFDHLCGVEENQLVPIAIRQLLEVRKVRCPLPLCNSIPARFGQIIAHLNDDHRWTRERIADWVATAEQEDSQPIHDAAVVLETSR